MASLPAISQMPYDTDLPSEVRVRPAPWVGPLGARPVRRLPDPLGIADRVSEGSCSSQESYELAQDLSTVLGPHHPVVDRYWVTLSFVPAVHLKGLRRSGCAIVFAASIADALASAKVTERRGRKLTDEELAEYRNGELLQAGLYEPHAHVLALPTRYRAADLERVAMHEVGHALLYRAASSWAADRADLLEGLPPEIAAHVFQDVYATADDERHTTYMRVQEALADAYLWVLAGRQSELSAALCRAVFNTLDGR